MVLLLSFIAADCCAQDSLDFGKVKADTAFNCKEERPKHPYLGIIDICNSKNQFELRLAMMNRPHGGKIVIILTYNDKKWDVKKYTTELTGLGELFTTSSYRYEDYMKNYIFGIVFDSLKKNNVFTLPGQEELNLKGLIFDGAAYQVTFKVNNSFRSYWFENPEDFLEENPGVTELKNYIEIVRSLTHLF